MSGSTLEVQDRRGTLPFFVHSEVDDYPLEPYEFRAYSRLCRRAGSTSGEAWESVENMAQGCKMSSRKLRYCLIVLEALGFIHRVERIGRTTLVYLLPQANWAPAADYDKIVAAALKRDPCKDPRQHWKEKPEDTPAPGAVPPPAQRAAPPAPGAAKGFPLEVFPSEGGGGDPREVATLDDALLPHSERSEARANGGGGFDLTLRGDELRAWNLAKATSDVTVIDAACAILQNHPDIWHTLAHARADHQPRAHQFQTWLTDVEKDIRLFSAEKVASDLKASFQNPTVRDFWGYYRTRVVKPPKVEKAAGGFSRSSRRRREPPAEGAGVAEQQALLERTRAEWAARGVTY